MYFLTLIKLKFYFIKFLSKKTKIIYNFYVNILTIVNFNNNVKK